MNSNKKPYLVGLIFLLSVYSFYIILFVGMGAQDPSPEGNYLTPGNDNMEYLFAVLMYPSMLLVFGFISIFLVTKVFLKGYIESLGKNQQFGLTKYVNETKFLKKMFGRALVLGFFITNISLSLSSNQTIAEIMAFGVAEEELTTATARLVLSLHFFWIVAIPCVIIIIPIWFMLDMGLVASKKIKNTELNDINLASDRFYKIIKGYAGIGFIYNFTLLIGETILITISQGHGLSGMILLSMMLGLFPLISILGTIPLIIILDMRRDKFRAFLWNSMKKLNLNNQISSEIKLTKVENYEDF